MTIESSSGALSLGRVISLTYTLIGRHFLLFFASAAVAQGLVMVVRFGILVPAATRWVEQGGQPGGMDLQLVVSTLSIVLGAVGAALFLLPQVIVMRVTIDELTGVRSAPMDALKLSVLSFFPLLLLLIVKAAAMSVGLALLIAPGVFLAIIWSVASPVMIIEHKGLMVSLLRSARLTKGSRWLILALLLIVAVLVLGTNVGSRYLPWPPGNRYWGLTFSGALKALQSTLWNVGAAVLYFELRSDREGFGGDRQVEVFD
jgi:hypothetical protein